MRTRKTPNTDTFHALHIPQKKFSGANSQADVAKKNSKRKMSILSNAFECGYLTAFAIVTFYYLLYYLIFRHKVLQREIRKECLLSTGGI